MRVFLTHLRVSAGANEGDFPGPDRNFHYFFTLREKIVKESCKLASEGPKHPLRRFSVSADRRSWNTAFYWTGIAMAVACVALILAGNTELAWRFEHASFPLSWAFAGVALLAFAVFEFCDSTPSMECAERSSRPS